MQREVAHFKESIGSIKTAEELIADRSLLKVALGAFGLQDDLNNKYLIRKILEDGTSATDALANRLSDRRYRQLSDAFGFGPDSSVKTNSKLNMEAISKRYLKQSFEVEVGQQSNEMRLVLSLQREIPELVKRDASTETKWFTVLGNPPLRSVFQVAFGFPPAVAGLNIDDQRAMFEDAAKDNLSITDFDDLGDIEVLKRLTERFLARSQLNASTAGLSSAQTALQLLQNS
ncbi:MAG: DUF1217 domain-containing protein [Paracoccaceae bacterium]